MNELLSNIGIILISVLGWLGQTALSLITNPIFAILMAVIIFLSLMFLLIKLINDRTGFIDRAYWNRRNKREIEKMPYYNMDNYDYESEYNSINN